MLQREDSSGAAAPARLPAGDPAKATLAVMDRSWIPVHRSWRLNERHYGALQGLDKAETAAQHGEEQVHVWRRSYATPPPPLELDDERHPRRDPRYAGLPLDALPAAESLSDVVVRMLPYWYDAIAPALAAGSTPIVSAHGNSLRALVKHLDGIADDVIPGLAFGSASQEHTTFRGILPQHYVGGGITALLHWTGNATTGTVVWEGAFKSYAAGQSLIGNAFVAANSVTPTKSGASRLMQVTSLAFLNGAEIDNLAGGDHFALRISRNLGSMGVDAELAAVELRET